MSHNHYIQIYIPRPHCTQPIEPQDCDGLTTKANMPNFKQNFSTGSIALIGTYLLYELCINY